MNEKVISNLISFSSDLFSLVVTKEMTYGYKRRHCQRQREKSKTKPLIKRKISNMREDQGKKIVFD